MRGLRVRMYDEMSVKSILWAIIRHCSILQFDIVQYYIYYIVVNDTFEFD